RALGDEIMELLSEPRTRLADAAISFELEFGAEDVPVHGDTISELASHYDWAARWLNAMADDEDIEDHVDVFFVEQVLRGLAGELELMGRALAAARAEGALLSAERVGQLYRRLAWIF